MANMKSLTKQWGELESTTVHQIYVDDIEFDTIDEERVREVVATMSDNKEFTIRIEAEREGGQIVNWFYVIESKDYRKTYEIDNITTGDGVIQDVLYLIRLYYKDNA